MPNVQREEENLIVNSIVRFNTAVIRSDSDSSVRHCDDEHRLRFRMSHLAGMLVLIIIMSCTIGLSEEKAARVVICDFQILGNLIDEAIDDLSEDDDLSEAEILQMFDTACQTRSEEGSVDDVTQNYLAQGYTQYEGVSPELIIANESLSDVEVRHWSGGTPLHDTIVREESTHTRSVGSGQGSVE